VSNATPRWKLRPSGRSFINSANKGIIRTYPIINTNLDNKKPEIPANLRNFWVSSGIVPSTKEDCDESDAEVLLAPSVNLQYSICQFVSYATQENLSLYSLYYAEDCNKLAEPISAQSTKQTQLFE